MDLIICLYVKTYEKHDLYTFLLCMSVISNINHQENISTQQIFKTVACLSVTNVVGKHSLSIQIRSPGRTSHLNQSHLLGNCHDTKSIM